MKNQNYLAFAIVLLVSSMCISCNKDDDDKTDEQKENQPPTCLITNPTNGQGVLLGDTVMITVEASDADGSVALVRLFINGIGVSSMNNSPYSYEWITGNSLLGPIDIMATSIDNNTAKTSDEISVILTDGSPVALFSVNTFSGEPPLSINFIDESENSPTAFFWDFGDGNTSVEQNPVHTYLSNGSYTVRLIVDNIYGSDTLTKADLIVITGGGHGSFTDARDGQSYSTIEIGEQIWFAENLNYDSQDSWWYENSSANGETYGRLYTWNAALTACPQGWHLPSNTEWIELEVFLGMDPPVAATDGWRGTDEGYKLKAISGWQEGGNGSNSSGFTALPAGYRDLYGAFFVLGASGYWWTATQINYEKSYRRVLTYDHDDVLNGGTKLENAISVRCLKD